MRVMRLPLVKEGCTFLRSYLLNWESVQGQEGVYNAFERYYSRIGKNVWLGYKFKIKTHIN